ncbi:flagellar hook-length control protein FliK [uncultured Aquitalea sp.]|uniref:flagellar hook-length control protein FliK n=1 Tax=uncultured Aquitalea sp. TaxID=540272 RepID=UPI0025D24548|nr:flagellar hook-length control protein FliK [uncultured Aquitalea sp.]
MIPSLPPTSIAPQTVSTVRLLLEGGRALLDASVLPPKLPPLVVGEQVDAQVLDRKDNGQLAVLIKNGLFTLNVPQGMDVSGDKLNLKVVNLSPTLTFALQEQTTPEESSKDGSVQVVLSPASRYLTGMLQSDKPARPMQDIGLNAAEQNPAEVAQDLKQNISQSGLFYESHLKDWTEGRGDLHKLQQEPQSRLLSAGDKSALSQLSQADKSPEPSHSATLAQAARAAAPEIANLVQRQLDVIENQQLVLNGLAWPGQPVQLQIQQEEANERTGGSSDEEQGAWTTSMSLKLPALGGLNARIRLVGQNVQISFQADDQEASTLIRRNANQLASGMAAAGLTLANLKVTHDGVQSGE